MTRGRKNRHRKARLRRPSTAAFVPIRRSLSVTFAELVADADRRARDVAGRIATLMAKLPDVPMVRMSSALTMREFWDMYHDKA